MSAVELPTQTADQLRAQMRAIRRDLRANVKEVVASAQEIFDWKSYVRSFPWASLAVAGVLGYLLVPRRMKVIAYDKETLENFLRERQLIAAPPPARESSQSLVRAILPIVGSVLLRVGMNYASKWGTEFVSRLAGPAEIEPSASIPRYPVPGRRFP